MPEPTKQQLAAENRRLRERLTQLSEASLLFNESLDYSTVLQGVIDASRALTGARYGGMLLYDDDGWVADYVSSGTTEEQALQFWTMRGGMDLQRHLESHDEALRIDDFYGYAVREGFGEVALPFPTHDRLPFLAAWMRLRGDKVGAIYLCDRPEELCADGVPPEFSEDDLDVLVMLASQAALVISNARKHRDEQRARSDVETLVDTVPVGVLVIDARSGTPTSLNRETVRIAADLQLAGGAIQDLFDRGTFRNSDGQQLPKDELPHMRALSSGEAVRAEEIVFESPAGPHITALVNATPMAGPDGDVESVLMTIQDMSPLADLDRLRAEFLGVIGHELRTPLSSIKGSATTLLETEPGLDEAETVQYYRIISDQADYMRDLIGDLIDIVRIETGTLSVRPAPADVAKLIDEARAMFLSAGGRDSIRVDIAPELPEVMADRRRFVQVVANLLSNAARNSHESSTIRVQAARDGVHVAVSVADDGRGVPAERLPRLFRRFPDPGGNEPERDLGLGLAICKGIVEAHGGRIWAESDGPGLGSRFVFTVPAADTPTAAPPRAPTATPRPPGRRAAAPPGGEPMRVLAVDDDPRTLKHIRDALEQAGIEPALTGDPNAVASLIAQNPPDVVVLDLMLPAVDGLELMRDVFAHTDIPVIFLSAYDGDELIRQAFELGAVDYIVKPFTASELAARVRAARRKQDSRIGSFTIGDLSINQAERSVTVAGDQIEFTPIEYALLVELSDNAGSALTHDQLLQRVWGTSRPEDARRLRTAIKNIRRKLGDPASSPTYIVTVPHVGYRMRRPQTA